jgi:hypothetical protein
MTVSRPPVVVPRASSYTPRVSMARFARDLPSLAGPHTAHLEDGSQARCYGGNNHAGLQPRWKCKNGRDLNFDFWLGFADVLRPVKERPQGPAEGTRTGCAMSPRQQASRSIQCRSRHGSVPRRDVLRPSRLPERNRHAGDFWRPNACFMTGWGQGEPESSRIRRVKGVLAIVLARDRSLGAIECESACTASRATTGAQLVSG